MFKPMKYFDAHSHYTSRKFSRDRHELFADMQKEGVAYVVDCFGAKEMNFGLSLAKNMIFIICALMILAIMGMRIMAKRILILKHMGF